MKTAISTLLLLVVGIGLLVGLNYQSIQRLGQSRIVNATEALAEIDSDRGYYPSDGIVELPQEELEKVVQELRGRYPFQSLAARLANLSAHTVQSRSNGDSEIELPEAAEESLVRLERVFDSWNNRRRVRSLEQLHSDEVESFINREGFGFSRRPPIQPSPKGLELAPLQKYVLNSQATKSSHIEGKPIKLESGHAISDTGLPMSGLLDKFHHKSLENFAAPSTLGYVRDIENVAGFQAHELAFSHRWDGSALSSTRPIDHDWRVNRIELVSLLAHDQPLVYESDQLPTMVESENRRTRFLNDFEQRGLRKLVDGEDVFLEANANRIEMMGAIRAAKNCLQCHSVERGKLLGAFTYEIFRDPPIEKSKENTGPGKLSP